MYQTKWGQKFICPDCSAKFYSMGKTKGLQCPSCGGGYDIQANRKLKNNQMLKSAAAAPAPLDDEVVVGESSQDAKADDVFADTDKAAASAADTADSAQA